MITTVTMNAALDKAYFMADKIVNGTVMRVSRSRTTAGGKGLNVARIVALCGAKVQATGLVGGYNGQQLEYLLEKDFLTYRNEELSKRYDTPIYLLQELLQEGENGNPQDAHLAFQGEDGIATDELWNSAQIREMAVRGWEMLMEYSGLGACGWLMRGENGK